MTPDDPKLVFLSDADGDAAVAIAVRWVAFAMVIALGAVVAALFA